MGLKYPLQSSLLQTSSAQMTCLQNIRFYIDFHSFRTTGKAKWKFLCRTLKVIYLLLLIPSLYFALWFTVQVLILNIHSWLRKKAESWRSLGVQSKKWATKWNETKQNKNTLGFSGKSLHNKVYILNTETLVVLVAYNIIILASIWRGKYVMKILLLWT